MNALMEYTPACAVGMTKEIDAPFGASRIYLNDDTWQPDVRELMEKSNSVFILVNERPSCIWEIEQSADFLDKVVYIVDDLDRYNSVKSKLTGKIAFPDIDTSNEELPFCMRIVRAPINVNTEEGAMSDKIIAVIYEFSNHKISYNALVPRLLTKETILQYIHRQKRTTRILLAVLFSVLLSLILLICFI